MSFSKKLIIVLGSFIAAAIVCIAVGLGLFFTALNLPASDGDRGTLLLAGIVVLVVGALNAFLSLTAMAAVLIKRYFDRKKK